MALHLVTSSRLSCKLLRSIRYDVGVNSFIGATAKQALNNGSLTIKQWMKPNCRQYHHSTLKNLRLLWTRQVPKNQVTKQRHQSHTKHGCMRRSFLFQRTGCFRIYSTKAGKNAVAKTSKKVAVPKMSEVRRLLSLAGPEKKPLFFGICLLVISSAVTISVPFALGKVIDIIYTSSSQEGGGNMMDKLRRLCGVLSVVFICGALANFGRVYLMQTSGQRIIKRLRESVFQSIVRQEVGFFDKTRTGELVNRLSTDSSQIGQSVTGNISDGLRSSIQAMGGIGMMFYSSVKLATVVMSIVPPVAVLAIVYGRYVRNISKQVQDSLANATEIAEERISSIRTVRAFSHESREMAAYSKKVEHVLELSKKEATLWGVFFGSMGLSGNLIILSVLYNGGMMMNEAQITVGDLSAFMLYSAYVGISISGLSRFYTELNKGLGASTRLWELMDRKPAIPIEGGSIPALSTLQGQLEFKNVNFAYPMRSDIPILKDLNLVVPSGKVTAVVGSSGSGKSTVAALALRYYDPQSGCVSLDGADIKSLDPKWLRHQIGTVSQDPILFSCSIAENIAYGAENPDNVSIPEIIDAAKTANAYDFVQGFTETFDTVVGERGLMLSGGQRQRIALARAVLKNPKILLLDEATRIVHGKKLYLFSVEPFHKIWKDGTDNALDAESEHLVQEALERMMVGRTVITIAHRLSTIKRAHAIAVIHNGTVAELGPYTQLINYKDGIFRKLVEKQTVMHD